MAVIFSKGKVRKIMRCYILYNPQEGTMDTGMETGKEEVTLEEFCECIDNYSIFGYPLYINGYNPSIYIYTLVLENYVFLLGCKVFDDKEYTLEDIKKINRLGRVGSKIYSNCEVEI